MAILIENGELFAPEPLGRRSLLLINDKIITIAARIDRRALEQLGIEGEVIDASDCFVTPGLLDPHEHLLGGSGEKGFATQTPEIFLREIATAGITTVVGCLGVDTSMKTLPGLLAKAKGLNEEGMTAFIWTGGYNVPPTTLTGSVRDDLLLIAETIGAGEVAIADARSTDPTPHELARLASDAYIGGMLSNKSGLTHFHVGDQPERLAPLRRVLDEHSVDPHWLYPTHVERSEELMREAIALAARGAFIDIDVVEQDLPRWLSFYRDEGGDPRQLTVSSDASISSPRTLFDQVRACVRQHGFKLEEVLPHATSNTARALKLAGKGELAAGKDADLLVLSRDGLELREVIARGRRLVRDGRFAVEERFLAESHRRIEWSGQRCLPH